MSGTENNLISFVKLSDNDRIERGKRLIDDGNYLKAISSLLPVLEGNDKKLIINSSKFLASAYFFAGNSDFTLFFNFLNKETDLFMSNVYLKVAHTYLKMHDYEKALSYFKRSFEEDDTFDDLAGEIIDMIYNSRKGFKVISNDDINSRAIYSAERLVANGHFLEAIQKYEKLNNLENERVRNGLCFAYMFLGETNKAFEIIKTYGQDSILDQCSLLILYYLSHDDNGYEMIGRRLQDAKKGMSIDEKFKVGLAYAETNNFNEALNYMTYYKKASSLDLEASLYYAITCINARKYALAKEKLLDLYNFDYFNRYIYLYYLGLCEKKPNGYIRYFFDVPLDQKRFTRQKVREYLSQSDEELKKSFNENKPFFFYITRHYNSLDNANLILRICSFQEEDFYLFTRFLLLGNIVSDKFKLKVLYTMLYHKSKETNAFMSITYRGYFYDFEIPDLDFYEEFIVGVRDVVFKTLQFFLEFVEPCKIDVTTAISQIVWGMKGKSRVFNFRKKKNLSIKSCQEEVNIMSSVLCSKILDMLGVQDYFRDVLRYFKVTQEEFYNYIHKNKIDF